MKATELRIGIIAILEDHLTEELHGKSNTIHKVNFAAIAKDIEVETNKGLPARFIRFGKFVLAHTMGQSVESIFEKWKPKGN